MRKCSGQRPCPPGCRLHPGHRPPHLMAWQLPLLDLCHQVAPARANPPIWRPYLHRSPWPGVHYSAPRRWYNFKVFGPWRTRRIPPSWRKSNLRSAQTVRVVQTVEHLTSSHLPLPCSKETETRAKEGLKKGREEKEEEDEKEEEEKEKEEDKKGEKKEEEQEGKRKEDCWQGEETEGKEDQKRGASSSHVQTPTTLETKVNMVSMRPPCGSEDGAQHPQDLPDSKEVTRKITHRLSTPSSHSPAGGMPSLGQSDVVAPGCPDLASSSCSTLQETFPKKELELCDLSHSAEFQESRKEGQSGKPQASALGTCAARPCKRKTFITEQPPSPPGPQLQWDRGDMPPPPKIPRTDKGKELDSTMTVKGQVIQSSDDNVAVLEPRTQGVAARKAPQSALPLPRPAAGHAGFLPPATNAVSSSAASASSPLAPQAAGPPIPCAPLLSLTPGVPTSPISPVTFPSDCLLPLRARLSLGVPPDANQDPAPLARASAPPLSLLPTPPGPEPSPFYPPSSRRESPTPMCIDPPSLSFPTAAPASFPRNAPTVFSTTAAHVCEDMSWEPSSEPAVMDMDTTPPSEAVILPSPSGSTGNSLPFAFGHGCATVSTSLPALTVPCPNPIGNSLCTPGFTDGRRMSMSPTRAPGLWVHTGRVPGLLSAAAITPSQLPPDGKSMDTTPPSQAVILHSPPVSDHVSTTLLAQAMWGPTSAWNGTGAPSQPTPALLKGQQQPAGQGSLRNPLTSIPTVALTVPSGQSANDSTTQLGSADPTSPADFGRPDGSELAYGKRQCAPSITTPTSGLTLSGAMGSGDCSSSSSNFTPSTPALVGSAPPLRGGNCRHGMRSQSSRPTACYYIAGRRGKDSSTAVAPIILKLRRPSTEK